MEPSQPDSRHKPRIGLALGGGGVRGLAHVGILEALDDAGLRPCAVAGTSIGAIMGAIYASGVPGSLLRERLNRHLILKDDTWRDILDKRGDLLRWLTSFSADLTSMGYLSTRGFVGYLLSEINQRTFEDLQIPLTVVATDYWTGQEVLFNSGDIMAAIQATMAVPGVFAPVQHEGRVLVDGGLVNLVPYDHLMSQADVVIAVDVSEVRSPVGSGIPRPLDAAMGAVDIMQSAALAEKLRRLKPDLFVRIEIKDVRMFDFAKAEEVLRQSVPAVEAFRAQLAELVPGP